MAKQRLGPKKKALCEQVGGRLYSVCYVRGGWPHFQAECWWKPEHPGESSRNADRVNWKLKLSGALIRDGQLVIEPLTEDERQWREINKDVRTPLSEEDANYILDRLKL